MYWKTSFEENWVFSASAGELQMGFDQQSLIWYAFRSRGLAYSWRIERLLFVGADEALW